MDAEIRPATREDISGIQRAVRASWHAAHDHVVGEEAVEAFLADYYTEEALEEQVADPAAVFPVADDDGIVGVATARETDDDGVWGLGRLYVHPDRWGEGIGTALLGRIESEARERGGDRLRLAVMLGNEVGVSFYESRGFERVEERVDDRFGVDVADYAKEL